MIIKNKMSAVLAACVFMLGSASVSASNVVPKIEYPGQLTDDMDEDTLESIHLLFRDEAQRLADRVDEANDKSMTAIRNRVNEIFTSLRKEFPNIEIPEITQDTSIATICEASEKIAKAALEKKSDKLTGTSQYQVIQRQVDTLLFFANISKNVNYLDTYVHVDNISKLLTDFPSLRLKHEPNIFGKEGLVAFATNTLNNPDVSREQMSELVNKILSFTRGLDYIKKSRIDSSIKHFELLRLSLSSLNPVAEKSAYMKDQDLEKIKDIFKGVRTDCELSNYFTKATLKALNESLAKTSKRIIKQLDKMHKVFSKEVQNGAGYPIAHRLTDIEELRQEIADFSIHDENNEELTDLTMPDMVAAMRRFVDVCERSDDFINLLHSELSDYQLAKVGSMVISSDKLAQVFINKAGKFFDTYSTEKIKRKYMRETIFAAFREHADARGMILGEKITPDMVAQVLAKIEVTVEDQVAISGMYHRLLRHISESNMSKADKAKTFAKTAVYKILSPMDKLCYKIKTKTSDSKFKEKLKYYKGKASEKLTLADKYMKEQIDKTKAKAKDVYVKISGKQQEAVDAEPANPDAVLNGFVLKPYQEYSMVERDRLIKLLEGVSAEDQKAAFAKVEKYTGRKVVPVKHKKTERFKQWWNSKTRKEDANNIYILAK